MAEYLASQGLDIAVPLLAGHGGSLEKLKQTSYQDWIKSVEDVFLAKSKQYQKIFIIGYSFGINIGLYLSVRYPAAVKGIISLGTFIFFKKKERLLRFLFPFDKLFPNITFERTWAKDKSILADLGKQARIPLHNMKQVAYLIDNFTKKELAKVKSPTLIIHSRDDEVGDSFSSEYLFNHLTIEDKSLFILNKHDHNPVVNSQENRVFNTVVNFIKSH